MTWTDTKTTGSSFTAVEYNNLIDHVRPTATATVAKSEPADYVTTNYSSDDACIQAAIDYVSGLGGGSVLVREGSYTIENSVSIPSNINFIGTGRATKFIPTTTNPCFTVYGSAAVGETNFARFITMRDFLIDGNERTTETTGIHVKWSEEISLSNIYIKHVDGTALKLQTTRESSFTDIFIEWCGSETNTKASIDIFTTDINDGPASNNLTFVGCKIIYPQYYSLYIHGVGKDTTYPQQMNFISCQLHGKDGVHTPTAYTHAYIENGQDIKFIACKFTQNLNNIPFIYLTGSNSYDNVFQNNVYKTSATGYSIQINDGNRCKISGNAFTGASQTSGVLIDASADQTVIGQDNTATTGYKIVTDNGSNTYNYFKNLISGHPTELTIASGVITKTLPYHTVDTEGDAASDDLVTISGGSRGEILVIRPQTTGRMVVCKNNTGNLRLFNNCRLYSTRDNITLLHNGVNWIETSRNLYSRPVGSLDGAGSAPSTPSVPATTVNYTNNYGYPCQVQVYGGTVTEIDLDDIATGLTSGIFIIPPGGTINITYSAAPSWRWWGL